MKDGNTIGVFIQKKMVQLHQLLIYGMHGKKKTLEIYQNQPQMQVIGHHLAQMQVQIPIVLQV